MKYTSDRKNQADDKITKAAKRYKKYASKSEGDYGDVEHQPDLRSESRGNMQDLLLNVLHEAKMFGGEAPVKCAVCGGSHHPAAKHTARALAPENNQVAEASEKEPHKDWKVIDMTSGRHVDTVKAPNKIAAKKAASKKGHDSRFHTCVESEQPTPAEMQKATIFKKGPGDKEVLDEKPINEGKTKKGPKWNGNSLTIKSTPEDIKRKAAATVGMPPPKKIIKSKKDKDEKYKKNWRDMAESVESHEKVLQAHGYKPTEHLDPEWKRYEHKDTSHVNLKVKGGNAGDWEHKGKNKSLVGTRGDSASSLDSHLKKVASRARSSAHSKAKDDALRSLGLTKVKGARGGTYWE